VLPSQCTSINYRGKTPYRKEKHLPNTICLQHDEFTGKKAGRDIQFHLAIWLISSWCWWCSCWTRKVWSSPATFLHSILNGEMFSSHLSARFKICARFYEQVNNIVIKYKHHTLTIEITSRGIQKMTQTNKCLLFHPVLAWSMQDLQWVVNTDTVLESNSVTICLEICHLVLLCGLNLYDSTRLQSSICP
jgi:hypothetical protein